MSFEELYTQMNESKVPYMGQCDKLRRTEQGERYWQEMMDHRTPISEEEFLAHVDPSPLLDEDETWAEWLENNRQQDPDLMFYRSGAAYFVQTAGFEFIWGYG